MLRFAKFLKKVELKLITYRDGFQVSVARKDKFSDEFVEKSAIIIIHPDTAKTFGFKDGQIVKVSSNDRSANLKLKIDEIAPKDGALIPKSIYSCYLFSDKVTIEPTDGEITTPNELLERYISNDLK